jgi:hypothetical protein
MSFDDFCITVAESENREQRAFEFEKQKIEATVRGIGGG